MAKKRWVNLPFEDGGGLTRSTYSGDGVDSIDDMGRAVYIEATFDKTDVGTYATLEIKPVDGNAEYKPGEFALAHDGLTSAKVAEDGKARWKVNLSAAGGDNFNFAVEHKKEKKDLPDEYSTHRRLYYQVIDMKTITGLDDLGSMEKEYLKNKREIHLTQIDSKGSVDHVYNFDFKPSEYARLFNLAKGKYNTDKDPYCFAVVWVDCLAQGPEIKTYESPATVKKGSGTVTIPIPNGQLWKDIDKSPTALDWDILTSFVYTKDGAELTYPIVGDDLTSTYDTVTVNTKDLPDGVTGKIVSKVWVATGFHGGWSFPSQNIIVIATRSWKDTSYKPPKKKAIVVHESGHKIGMVPDGTRGLLKQTTYDEVHDPRKKSHCNDKACTMWYATTYEKDVFCDVCDKSVRKINLFAPTLSGFKRFF